MFFLPCLMAIISGQNYEIQFGFHSQLPVKELKCHFNWNSNECVWCVKSFYVLNISFFLK